MKIFTTVLLALIASIALAGGNVSDDIDAVNNQDETIHQIVFDSAMIAEYRVLAAELGFNYDTEYRYGKFADISHAQQLGSAGNYEPLLNSTGGNLFTESAEDMARRMKAVYVWEMYYYKNYDLTAISQTRKDGDTAYTRWLKLAKGRVPNLHQEQ